MAVCCAAAEAAAGSPPPERRAPAAWRGDPPALSSLPLLPDGRVDYSSIDRLPQSLVLTAAIRKLLNTEVGADLDPRPWTSFDALMTPVRAVNDRPGSAADVTAAARRVFQGILPSLALGWVPPAWRRFIAPTFPPWLLHFSFYLVFASLFPWLMGPLQPAEHVIVHAPKALHPLLRSLRLPRLWRVPQAVKAERCRFLEAAQCASVCVNSCKVPTQQWMADDFGLKLHIQPNYNDFSCTWSFGKEAPPLEKDDALNVPCFSKCTSADKGRNDAAKAIRRAEALEAIAARASPGALADAAAGIQEQADAERRLVAVATGKCWSVADDRASALTA